MKKKCQCDEVGKVSKEREYMYSEEEKSGMNHDKGKCKGTNKIKKYKRGEKILWLCSCCNLFGDIEID